MFLVDCKDKIILWLLRPVNTVITDRACAVFNRGRGNVYEEKAKKKKAKKRNEQNAFFFFPCLEHTIFSKSQHLYCKLAFNSCSLSTNQNTDYTVLVQIGTSLNFAPCQVFHGSRYNQIPRLMPAPTDWMNKAPAVPVWEGDRAGSL